MKEYLGDAVYIDDGNFGGVVLTTSNGVVDTNTIHLDDSVLKNLFGWIERKKEVKNGTGSKV